MEQKVILASASPRRQELLKNIFPLFTVCPSKAEEIIPESLDVFDAPEYLARLKAFDIAKDNTSALIIAADTAVIIGDEILGKPKDKTDAFKMISKLSGKTHYVVTGCALVKNGIIKSFSQKTAVTFYKLTENEILSYIDTNEPYDKAGAYGIQGKASLLVEKIDGDYFNVVGLPIAKLYRELENF